MRKTWPVLPVPVHQTLCTRRKCRALTTEHPVTPTSTTWQESAPAALTMPPASGPLALSRCPMQRSPQNGCECRW